MPDAGLGIPRRPPGSPAPLSSAQQRFWLFERVWPGTSVYNRPVAIRMRGRLDASVLEHALDQVLRRHESLRTRFDDEHGIPRQVVCSPDPIRIPLRNLTALAKAAEDEARRLVQAEIRRPFDLTRTPLRSLLLRLAEDHHILVITVHHIVFDGWSAGVLLRELAANYDALLDGGVAALEPLPIQCADHAAWQASRLQGARHDAAVRFWREHLSDAPPRLPLAPDHAGAARSFAGGQRHLRLEGDAIEELAGIARRRRATPFMALLAVYAVLLQRYTGSDDMVIGCPIAGRTHLELEPLIGCFINTLPLRLDLRGDPTFLELLERVRTTALGAFAHQELPLQSLVEMVQPERDGSRPPLFQALFNFRNLPPRGVAMRGLSVEEMDVETGAALVDVALDIARRPDAWRVTLEYDAARFEGATADGMLGHFEALARGAAAAPEAAVSSIDMEGAEERAAVIAQSAGPRRPLPSGQRVDALIADRAAASPQAAAVVSGEGTLTYTELDAHSRSIAAALRNRGVRPGDTVGVCARRSPELVTAMLGVLRAGGTYLPLDPDYPDARLSFMLGDARPKVVLADTALRERLTAFGANVIVLADARDVPDADAADDGAQTLGAAYVMYTSGSTGTPKGVLVAHRGVLNHNLAVVEAFALKEGDRVLQFASPSFDASLEEILPTLIAGATLVLRTDNAALSARAFMEELDREQITVANLPTAFWREVVFALPDDAVLPECLRLVVIGGEAASAAAYRRWRSLAKERVQLLNTYGPTEATIVATLWDPARAPVADDTVPPPIGRPLSNVRAYVLDRSGTPQPYGVPGELWIGGPGVALGYIDRPTDTAARFAPDPFAGESGARMYRTGDRARWRTDGLLEFLGRLDAQVKIRGHRVEPGEIEAVLREQPGVRDAAVAHRGGEPDDARLIAYVAAPDPTVTSAGLRTALAAILPAHMVPDTIVRLEGLPRDDSGKIDRRRLDIAATAAPSARRIARAPDTDTEARLLSIWRELLDNPELGVDDEFFASGGHSLLALRLTARVERELGVRLAPSVLFEHPTVARMAARLGTTDESPNLLVPLQPNGSRTPFFCVHAFFGEVMPYRRLAARLAPDRPFYGIQPPDVAVAASLLHDVPALAARYVDAIRVRQPEGPYTLGGLCSGGVIAYEMAQQLSAAGQHVALLALFDANARSPGTPAGLASEESTPGRAAAFAQWARGAADLTIGQWMTLLRLKRRLIVANLSSALTGSSGNGAARVNALADAMRMPDTQRTLGAALREGLRRYAPAPYHGRVVLYRPRMQPRFSTGDPTRGWGTLVDALTVCTVPANHLAMLEEPHVATLARALAAHLDAALAARQDADGTTRTGTQSLINGSASVSSAP